MDEFDIGRFLNKCHNLKVFTVDFKDSPIRRTPIVLCSSLTHCLNTLVHVQFGLVVQVMIRFSSVDTLPFICRCCLTRNDYSNLSQDSLVGSISAWYRGGPGFKSQQWKEFFDENK